MCGPRLEHTHLSPEVLAQGGLCCPTPHRLATSSASLRNSASLPGFAGYRRGLWLSRVILPAPPGPFYCPGSGRGMMGSADTWRGSVASPDLAGRPHEAARTGRTALLRRRAQVSSGASRRAEFCDDARGIRRRVCSGSCRGHPAHGRHSGGWPRAGSGSAPCSARWRWPRWSGRRDCAGGGARKPGTGLHRR